ncbi:hypothetical protein EU98_2015 [Prochlorococcus marinus str. MIT 9314]|uniref:Uncharacterized protein n=1 Tax=Prochlorococcus marinus str. MIT 9314 TaxID=167548 RepID=A0A0A2AF16_PROMR|nr:hypothetical protein EU98_2015 [Prochlorococcus marinus str. MIT 9314]
MIKILRNIKKRALLNIFGPDKKSRQYLKLFLEIFDEWAFNRERNFVKRNIQK